MIKFVNKKGTKVMEMTDNGDVNILSNALKESFSSQTLSHVAKEKENKKEEKNDE